MDEGRRLATIGLVTAGLVVTAAVAFGFWRTAEGCAALAAEPGRELVANEWWMKTDTCTTTLDGVTESTNEAPGYVWLVVIAAIPLGIAAGVGAVAAYAALRHRRRVDDGPPP